VVLLQQRRWHQFVAITFFSMIDNTKTMAIHHCVF
jgi:hypothetical protein